MDPRPLTLRQLGLMIDGKREYEGFMLALLRFQVAGVMGFKHKPDLDAFNPFPSQKATKTVSASEFWRGRRQQAAKTTPPNSRRTPSQ